MAETIVKQRAFAFIMFDFQNWDTRLALRWAIFITVNMRQNITGIPPDCDRLAEKLALSHLRLFPRSFSNHATECKGGVGVGTAYVTSKVCQIEWLCGPISACATLCCYQCLAVKSIWNSCWNTLWCSDRTLMSSMRSVYDVLPLWLRAGMW